MIRLSIADAVASMLGKKDHVGYRDLGVKMKVKPLASLLGVTTPMLYNYMNNKTFKIEAERALVILNNFDVLINEWGSEVELRQDMKNEELGAKIAREPIKEIIEELVEIESLVELKDIQRAMRLLIAKYY